MGKARDLGEGRVGGARSGLSENNKGLRRTLGRSERNESAGLVLPENSG